MTLASRRHWVFDMDGTLTLAVHDFPAIRRALDIPENADILGHLASLPEQESRAKHAWLLEHERELAGISRPAPGAVALVRQLRDQGCELGILTRNARELAWVTLRAIGLDDCFTPAEVLGRDEAKPKPDPDGLYRLAALWHAAPERLVMVGDGVHDLDAGRRAGAYTVLVNRAEGHDPRSTPPWPELVDLEVRDCAALAAALRHSSG